MKNHTLKAVGRIRTERTRVIGSVAMALSLAMGAQAADTPTSPAAAPSPASAKAKSVSSGHVPAMPGCTGTSAVGQSVAVAIGKTVRIDLAALGVPSPAWLRAMGDPDVLKVDPMASATPQHAFLLFGKQIGGTNLMFQNKEGQCAVIDVSVAIDGSSLQAKLAQLMPGEKDIQVGAAADAIVLSGTVKDALAVERAIAIANAYLRKAGAAAPTGAGAGEHIVNMLSVSANQQVMLEVKVAEISKTLVDQLGVNFSGVLNRGDWAANLVTNFLSNGAGVLSLTKQSSGKLIIDAERRDALVKILAEPNIMAISGQEGSFLAGGKIFIPVAQSGNGGAASITLEEKEFGIGLRFTPTVLDGGRINLKVAPEVSELSREGVGLSTPGAGLGGNAVLPFVTTRRVATTVQLADGQSFAIAGLIKNNVTQNIKAFPILGELPVLGALFRSSNFQTDKSELVFVITPRLVKPLAPNYPLPTDDFNEPTRGEFFIQGKMEGAARAGTIRPADSAKPLTQAGRTTGFDTN
jgi:pilus assembly protein CpaC